MICGSAAPAVLRAAVTKRGPLAREARGASTCSISRDLLGGCARRSSSGGSEDKQTKSVAAPSLSNPQVDKKCGPYVLVVLPGLARYQLVAGSPRHSPTVTAL